MCISCGCGKPNDDHGDARNITMQDVDQAAEAAGTTRAKVLENIMQGSQQTSTSNEQAQQVAALQSQNNASVYSQSQAEQNRDAQVNEQPGTYAPSPGHDSGSDWGQDQQQINYRPPEEQEHVS
ncbi:MAG: hypothetical protein ACJ8BW_12935 [Ktedonobacteraceae bacterium]